MAHHYVMTNWGPMKVFHGTGGSISKLIKDAPEDMDTFLEVYEKYQNLKNEIDNLDIPDLIKEVNELPEPSKDSLNSIYIVNETKYITVNTGTEESPKYSWKEFNIPDQFATLEDIDNLWTNEEGSGDPEIPPQPEEPKQWATFTETIDLTNYTPGKNTITWETDNVTIKQVTGQGVTQVNPNYYSPIRFYDSNILKFEGKYPAVYITKIKLTKNNKDGGGIIKPGTKTGYINGKEAVVISTRLTATKTETGWEIVSDEGFDTNTINLQYDGKVIEESALQAIGQLQITGIEITYKHLV